MGCVRQWKWIFASYRNGQITGRHEIVLPIESRRLAEIEIRRIYPWMADRRHKGIVILERHFLS